MVQVGEELLAPDHVVGGAVVEVPSVELVLTEPGVEENLCAWLVDVEVGSSGRGVKS